ncbi:thiamine phosphate synthase [Kineococcus rhizosphaerae]|uniref:Thiamine-phosphate synthase n=1 Tax=Kineococcus rhizosphaerae TaxID=559628 RepID=A0A2T0QY73_9ACTN|nr:thiamine phosphate synthase [Kineococcus rhizosphaerae]PRY11160.1 thiamine-phosphate pyrophosphorylase [Kineococcus rhizosphaerae]
MSFAPSLYLVTDTAQCGDRGVPAVVRAAVAGGVDAVQVRAKHGSDRDRLALVVAVRDVLAGTGVPLLVNDAVDVALIAGVDGVHLGQSDLPAEDVRRIAPDLLIGLSVSGVEQARRVDPAVVDHLGVGPVRDTATKPDAAAALGADGVRAVVAASPVPCVAIGGIHPDNLDSLRDTGITGFCVVSEICGAADPERAARELLASWRRA